MLLIDERILADGTHAKTHADAAGDRIVIRDDDGTHGELSVVALDRVMVRYGKPLDPDAARAVGDEHLAFTGGYRLRRLRFHAAVDATGRDYLVWERPGDEPLCVIATMATAALRYLVLRLGAERGGEPGDGDPQESEA